MTEKLTIGTKVRVVARNTYLGETHKIPMDTHGEIIDIGPDEGGKYTPYQVEFAEETEWFNASEIEPLPSANLQSASVTNEVIALLKAREQKGIKTYGTSLMSHNGRDALQDLIEELADALQYAVQLKMERDSK